MNRLVVRALLAAVVAGLLTFAIACPERKEAIDQVGGAPAAQVDVARERLQRAEQKLEGNAGAAAAVGDQ